MLRMVYQLLDFNVHPDRPAAPVAAAAAGGGPNLKGLPNGKIDLPAGAHHLLRSALLVFLKLGLLVCLTCECVFIAFAACSALV